jgi:hypothetical protein
MSSAYAVFHIARANFLERIRRRNFLFVLLSVTLISIAIGTGRLVLRLDVYLGEFNSSWIGALVAGSTTVLLCFANFFLVKNALELDRRMGVGELVSAAPTSKLTYLLGKVLSNFALLMSIECILIVAAILIQFVYGEMEIEWLILLLPFVFIAIPAMAVISALALFFETIPGLRSGFGNLVFVFLWFVMNFVVMHYNDIRFDLPGLLYVDAVFTEAAQAMGLPFTGGFSIEGGTFADTTAQVVKWQHVSWVNEIVWWRLYWFVIAIGLTFLAALTFDRFCAIDRMHHLPRRRPPMEPDGDDDLRERTLQEEDSEQPPEDSCIRIVTSIPKLTPAIRLSGMGTFLRVLWLELRLMMRQPWWWYLVTFGLIAASLITPVQDGRTLWVPLVWLWMALTLSGLGLRETQHHTTQLVFSTPPHSAFQVFATWLSGLILTIVAGIGGTRLFIVGDMDAALAWGIAALFIPTLALTFGILSGNRRLFEGLFVAWWLMGPMGSKGTWLDFMGVHEEVVLQGLHWKYLGVTIPLLFISILGRWWQRRLM